MLTRRSFLAVPALALPAWAGATDLDRRVRSRMQVFIDRGEIPGAVTVVGGREGVLSLLALGNRALDGPAMREDTLFRIASMTKPITAIAVMQLQEAGRLSVEDPVEKHLPEFRGQMMVESRAGGRITLTAPPRPITLRDLLTHTSGLPGGPPAGLEDLYRTRSRSLAEAVMAFSQRPLDFAPGTRWAYCNTGIDTLGRVVEAASGRSFEDYLSRNVFRPLGMKDTLFYPDRARVSRLAPIYDRREGRLVLSDRPIIGPGEGARYPIPAGGLLSTGPDLALLYQAMLGMGVRRGTRILSEESVRVMTRVQTGALATGFVPGMGFGFGWAVVREPQGVTAMLSRGAYGHGGAFGTQAWLDPTRDRFAVLLIARTGLPNADASDMRLALQEEAWRPPARTEAG